MLTDYVVSDTEGNGYIRNPMFKSGLPKDFIFMCWLCYLEKSFSQHGGHKNYWVSQIYLQKVFCYLVNIYTLLPINCMAELWGLEKLH